MKKYSGVLMHISSLPSDYGIGTLGKQAYEFVDFLSESGQTYWQILPLGPFKFGDNPYSSFSAFAGNPFFIDFDLLRKDKLLHKEDYQNINWGRNPQKVDFAKLFKNRNQVLKIAFNNFKANKEYDKFCNDNKKWLDNYALFMALKEKFNNDYFYHWPKDYRLKNAKVINQFILDNFDSINYYKFIQFEFFKQWLALKKYANSKNIQLFGDCPIYVSLDSADVWGNKEIFKLNKECLPCVVSGVPPDYFSKNGQIWNNPIYNWNKLKKDHYQWWLDRLRHYSKMYDVLRIDHFIGFANYYEIPYGAKDGKIGKHCKGPGLDFIKAINRNIKHLKIVAEDLGVVTDDVRVLLKQSTYPGMRVMRFGYNGDLNNDNLAQNFPINSFGYITSHDTETCMEWYRSCSEKEREFIKESCYFDNKETANWNLINALLSSKSKVVIIQAQDLLGLGKGYRMNTPGTTKNNWLWRTNKNSFNHSLALKLLKYTHNNGRNH